MTAGALMAAIAVMLGAFAAHALKARLDATMLAAFETGVRYQFYHALGLLAAGIAYAHFPSKNIRLASTFFIIGTVLFSGSLYAMAFLSMTGASLGPAGIITPIGGLFFILGWILMFLGFLKKAA